MVLVEGNDEIIIIGMFGNCVVNTTDTCSNSFEGKLVGCYLFLKCRNEFWCLCEFINANLDSGHGFAFDFLNQLRMTQNKFCS